MLLSALPQKPQISYADEGALLLDGLERVVSERILSSRLTLQDMEGKELTLWDAWDESLVKRVSFFAPLRVAIPTEEWQKKRPLLPYHLEMTEPHRAQDDSFVRVRREASGDLKDFCYKRQKDGSYALALPAGNADRESALRTVLLGISVTAVGISCHLFETEST